MELSTRSKIRYRKQNQGFHWLPICPREGFPTQLNLLMIQIWY